MPYLAPDYEAICFFGSFCGAVVLGMRIGCGPELQFFGAFGLEEGRHGAVRHSADGGLVSGYGRAGSAKRQCDRGFDGWGVAGQLF